MIRFGLRLTFRGGKEAIVRLVITAVAVALGVGLLLITLAGVDAVKAQNARYAWLSTGPSPVPAVGTRGPAHDPLWWLLRADRYGSQIVGRVDVAATGPSAPVPPGIPHLPGPGQFYASPALGQLLRTTPAGQLGGRFPGRQVGTIGAAALPSPNSLVIIVGGTASQLSHASGAFEVTRIQTEPRSCNGTDCQVGVGINTNGIDLILAVVACALLLPVLIFIGTATRLSAARREQRFAAMRLAGAGVRQVSVISAVESTAAAVCGVVIGFGLFYLLRSAVSGIPFTGAPFYPSDLSLSVADFPLVAIGVPAAAAITARLSLRRVSISPLGVSRRSTSSTPRIYRLLPILAGLLELAFFAATSPPNATGGQLVVYLPGFFLIMAGLIISGPWFTMLGAKALARRTSRPATLIAARRLADNPGAGFRAISGLILALFVTSVAVGVITTTDAHSSTSIGAATSNNATLAEELSGPAAAAAVPGTTLAKLGSVHGVQGVAVIHANPLGTVISGAKVGLSSSFGRIRSGLVSCAQLAHTPALGSCPAGAAAVAIPAQILPAGSSLQSGIVWSAAAISAGRLESLPAQTLVVSTTGATSAIERARTALEAAYPGEAPPGTIAELRAGVNSPLAGWQQLADVVILASLPIAGCALAVSVVSGLSDRKRPFSLLRLTGAPLSVLRRVVALESAVPLLVTAVISIGAGFLTAQLYLTSQLGYSLRPPGPAYYLIVVAGIAASLGIIGSTFPMLQRITRPEAARTE
jgi:hypothetical protein